VKDRPYTPERIAATIVTGGLLALLAVTASGQESPPRKIKDVKPAYPRESLLAGDEGVIILELRVTTSGAVGDVRILMSHCKRLEQAALAAVRQWRYEPARLDGKPAPFVMVVPLPFRLPPQFKHRAGRVGACKWTESPKRLHE
jgi:protein TonB